MLVAVYLRLMVDWVLGGCRFCGWDMVTRDVVDQDAVESTTALVNRIVAAIVTALPPGRLLWRKEAEISKVACLVCHLRAYRVTLCQGHDNQDVYIKFATTSLFLQV